MIPYFMQQGDTKVLMIHDKPFLMLAGEMHNSASSTPEALEHALERADNLGLNTVLAAVSWERIEPEEGVFDFSSVDMLLELARAHRKKVGVLWFGAWKNAQCYYAPGWVKSDLKRFRRAEMVKGQRKLALKDFYNFPYTTLSAFCPATREADARAYAALLSHLKAVDGEENTVVYIQVENETGFMGAAREHSDEADAAFAQPVPPELPDFLRSHRDTLAPDVREALESGAGQGSWEQVFGPVAEELFTAWHTASYVNYIAAAGKAVYPLPTAVNCWLDKGHKPGRFPSGGPVARVLELWKLAAPHIDVMGPDVYVPYFCQVCDSFRKLGNPLLIPEAATHGYAAVRQLYAFGHYHALCCSPFGYEEMGEPFGASAGVLFGMDTSDPALRTPQDPAEYRRLNELLAGLTPLLGETLGTERLQALSSERKEEPRMDFGAIGLEVRFSEGPGACLALQTGPDELWVLAMHCAPNPVSLDETRPHLDYLALEEGHFDECGSWHVTLYRNGDEAALLQLEEPTLLRMKLLQYN